MLSVGAGARLFSPSKDLSVGRVLTLVIYITDTSLDTG
jgi:hypothetical protein